MIANLHVERFYSVIVKLRRRGVIVVLSDCGLNDSRWKVQGRSTAVKYGVSRPECAKVTNQSRHGASPGWGLQPARCTNRPFRCSRNEAVR